MAGDNSTPFSSQRAFVDPDELIRFVVGAAETERDAVCVGCVNNSAGYPHIQIKRTAATVTAYCLMRDSVAVYGLKTLRRALKAKGIDHRRERYFDRVRGSQCMRLVFEVAG